METMGATDEELHELVKLAMDDRKGEAERLMAEIVRRDTEIFRRVIDDEMKGMVTKLDSQYRSFSVLARVTGLFAGIAVAVTVMYVRQEFFGTSTGIGEGAFLTVACAAFGTYAGWRRAK